MAENINRDDLEMLIGLCKESDFGSAYDFNPLIKKLQALIDSYWLYPDVWVSTVMLVGNEVVERRADVWHVSPEVFDEIAGIEDK